MDELLKPEELQQQQTTTTTKRDVINHDNNSEDVIYPVTECCNSEYTRQSYKNSFDRFLKYIKVYDLQVLVDFGDKALEQLIIKYVIHSRDEKKLARGSIEVYDRSTGQQIAGFDNVTALLDSETGLNKTLNQMVERYINETITDIVVNR